MNSLVSRKNDEQRNKNLSETIFLATFPAQELQLSVHSVLFPYIFWFEVLKLLITRS